MKLTEFDVAVVCLITINHSAGRGKKERHRLMPADRDLRVTWPTGDASVDMSPE